AAEGGEEGDGAWVTPAQGVSGLTVVVGRQDDFFDGAGGDGAVLGYAFDGQEAVVDVASDGAEVGEVADVAADAEVVGIVERGLGAERPLELEVLLDAGALVVEAEAGVYAVGDDAGPEASGRALGDLALEQELHLVGAADVEV